MALAPGAVKAYLDRPFANWSVYKRLSDQRLDGLARRYGVSTTSWKRLRRHQKIMMLILLRIGRFALFADTGTGKTFTILATVRHLQQTKRIRKILVLVPRKVNKEEWALEITKHAPDLPYCVLPSSIEDKWSILSEDESLITIETYTGLYRMACSKGKNKKGQNKLKPDKRAVYELKKIFDGIVLDESHNAKTRGKLPFRICRALTKTAKMVVVMSGTPHGRDPTDLWGQMMIVDGGETLGQTLGLYRAVFFSESKEFFGRKKYEFRKSQTRLLNTILSNNSIRFEADQADLPRVSEIVKACSLPEDTDVYYQKALQAMRKAGNYTEQKNAWLRMRQISSGFVGFKDDDSGKRVEFTFDENPKMELLLSSIESIDSKAIVFYEYTFSGLRIAKELKALGINALHLYGGSKDQQVIRRRFNDDPSVRVLVMQNSFGEGLNLQAARYGFFYESPVSPITRKQCRRRFERQNSPHSRVFQYDFVCRRTVDEEILAMLKEGQDLFRAIIDGKTAI